jgi:hypothetical protein
MVYLLALLILPPEHLGAPSFTAFDLSAATMAAMVLAPFYTPISLDLSTTAKKRGFLVMTIDRP